MHNSIISRRTAIQKSISDSFNGSPAKPRIYTAESLESYSNDLQKSLDSKNITKTDYELGMKAVSDLKQVEIGGKTLFVEA